MVAIDEKYIPRKADNSGPQNPTLAWQGKQGYQFEQPLGAAGLQYVRQRWYDPSTRQFISPDPLGFPDAAVPWGVEQVGTAWSRVTVVLWTTHHDAGCHVQRTYPPITKSQAKMLMMQWAGIPWRDLK